MTTHTIEKISPCEKRITITIDSKTVKKAIKATVQKKAGKINYGGFRPNTSITQNLVAKKITPHEEQEVHWKLCKDNFSSLTSKENINYEGTPLIKSINPNEDGSLSYVVLIETYPEISHVQWEGAKLEKLDTQITEETIENAAPLLKQIGIDTATQSKEQTTQWCHWMIEIFQRQKIRDQVIAILLKENTVNDLPQRVIEERYQELIKEHQDTFDEKTLRERAQQYITTDILFKAYALEHSISVDRETFLTKVKEASKNPFIMSHVKSESLLPYYLAPRVFEDAVIDHLVSHSDCTTQTIELKDFIKLAFNQELKEHDSESLEKPKEDNNIVTSEHLTQSEEEVA